MARNISSFAAVDAQAEIADDVVIGPFCVIGKNVKLGAGCVLDNNVTIVGHTTIGQRNRFFSGSVVGAEPQDFGYTDAPTMLFIGDDNLIREGVTINRGAEKEDGITRVGSRNFIMANAHVAHNCCVGNDVILTNGCLLGGHVHVHDHAIVSGNSVVHHFTTIGTLGFLAGGCRCVTDIPPYMLMAGTDNPQVIMINAVGMKRQGISENSIQVVRRAFKLMFREHRSLADTQNIMTDELQGVTPIELGRLFDFLAAQKRGKNGRAREVVRGQKPTFSTGEQERRAA